MEDNKNTQAAAPETQTHEGKVTVSFAAIDPVLVTNIRTSEEVTFPGRDIVFWGKRNDFPAYLAYLRKNAATLHSVIDGCVNYAIGDRIEVNPISKDWELNRFGETIRDFARCVFMDLFTFGGFAFEVIRNEGGNVCEVHSINLEDIRSNKENEVFFYSEDWSKRFGKKSDLIIPKFMREGTDKSSLFFYKNNRFQTYPECPFEGALIAAELERAIDEYHLNSMENGFTGSYIVNFNNGVPEDEIKKEIEKKFNQKFSGHKNAGRILFSWNDSRETQTTLQKMEATDFADKYDALSKRSRQQIFTAFRANPNLFGIPTENLGFSKEEYEGAFKLFNRTVIQPAQRIFIEALQKVWDANVRITPFTLDGDGENTETAE